MVTKAPLGNLDGIELIAGGYLVSDWVAGKVYFVDNRYGFTEMFFEGLGGAADLGFDPKTGIAITPAMKENKIYGHNLY